MSNFRAGIAWTVIVLKIFRTREEVIAGLQQVLQGGFQLQAAR